MSLESIVPLIVQYRYLILLPLTFIEGPIIGFIAGALSKLGYFNPYLAFSIFIFRDVLVDGLWYLAGSRGGKTKIAGWFLKKVRVTDEHLHAVRKLWDRHPLRTMLISKLSYGISQLFLAVAGMVGMPFARYFRYALIVALIEYGGLFICGYIVGGAFGSIAGVLSNIQWVIAILALVIAAYYIFTHYMRGRALAAEKRASEERD
jgi:membrane protein DedA with SNARE-associated domain